MGVKFDYILRKLRQDDTYDDTVINAALAQEILDRIAADTTLQTNITNEANTRSGADTALSGRITILENNEIKVYYSAQINAQSGTITKPTNSTILADEFPGGVDAFVTTISGGEPTGDFPRTATGELVDVATFDTSGNYTLTGIPSSYPVMLIYVLKIKEIDASNLTLGDIIEQYKMNDNHDSFDVSFDGQGGVIAVNANAIKRALATNGTITGFSLKGNVSGSIEIDMKKNGTSMVGAGNKIDLITQSSDTGLPTSWTSTTFVADDEIEWIVSSATTITKLWLTIKYDKTS